MSEKNKLGLHTDKSQEEVRSLIACASSSNLLTNELPASALDLQAFNSGPGDKSPLISQKSKENSFHAIQEVENEQRLSFKPSLNRGDSEPKIVEQIHMNSYHEFDALSSQKRSESNSATCTSSNIDTNYESNVFDSAKISISTSKDVGHQNQTKQQKIQNVNLKNLERRVTPEIKMYNSLSDDELNKRESVKQQRLENFKKHAYQACQCIEEDKKPENRLVDGAKLVLGIGGLAAIGYYRMGHNFQSPIFRKPKL